MVIVLSLTCVLLLIVIGVFVHLAREADESAARWQNAADALSKSETRLKARIRELECDLSEADDSCRMYMDRCGCRTRVGAEQNGP